MNRLSVSLLVASILLSAHAAPVTPFPLKIVNRIAHEFMQRNHVPGLAIDVNYQGKAYYLTYGLANKQLNTPVTPNTIFEIGSVTKVFTATVLALKVNSNTIGLSENVGGFLPQDLKGAKLPIDQVSFLDLATHTASLPDDPTNFHPQEPYGLKQFIAFLRQWVPAYPVGTKYKYSNVGFGVLGYALAGAAHKPFWTLLNTTVLQPLLMRDTSYIVPHENQFRYAMGYRKDGQPAPRWKMTAWRPAAGALRSTPADMMKFLMANMGAAQTNPDLFAAMDLAHRSFFTVNAAMKQGLAWATWQLEDGSNLIHKNGGTAGFSSMIAFIPKMKIGVVVLANKSGVRINRVTRALLHQLSRVAH